MDTKKPSKKIFLILGIAREPDNWRHPIKTLQEVLPDFEVIALDNPGMGIHHKIRTPRLINGNLNFLKQKFDTLKGDENYLLGWSMGGMIAAKWSQLYPDDIKGIILMSTSFGSLQMPWYRIRLSIIPKVGLAIFSRGKKRENLLFESICRNENNRQMLVEEWYKTQKEKPVKTINILRQLNACIYFLGINFKQNHPALIIGAVKDNLVNNKCSDKLAGFWKDAKYVVHPTAGHDVFNDDPQWVSNEIKVWLNKFA